MIIELANGVKVATKRASKITFRKIGLPGWWRWYLIYDAKGGQSRSLVTVRSIQSIKGGTDYSHFLGRKESSCKS